MNRTPTWWKMTLGLVLLGASSWGIGWVIRALAASPISNVVIGLIVIALIACATGFARKL